MHSRSKLLLAGWTAALALALMVGTASGNRLSLSERSFRATWSSVSLELRGWGTIRCPMTMEGSFHSATLAKTPGALVGLVTRNLAGTCTGGALTVLTMMLPWHIRYRNFLGTLPNITSIGLNLINQSWRVNVGLITCLARSTIERPALYAATLDVNRRITRLDPDPSIRLPVTGSFPCEETSLGYAGAAAVTRLASAELITVALI